MSSNKIKNKVLWCWIVLFILGLITSLLMQYFCNKSKAPNVALKEINSKFIFTSPALSEIAFSLGLKDSIVGLGDACLKIHPACKAKNIGKWGSINCETLISTKPDVVFTQGATPSLISFLSSNNIAFVDIKVESISDIISAIKIIGEECGAPEKSIELVRNINQTLRAIKTDNKLIKGKKVLITIGRQPGQMTSILTSSSATFIGQLFDNMGYINIFKDGVSRWPVISKEALLSLSPDLIIEIIPEKYNSQKVARMKNDWQQMHSLNAVKNDCILYLCNPKSLLPSSSIIEVSKQLATLINNNES